MAAIALPEGDGAPEWVPLIPAGGVIQTHDGRGPYRVENAEALAQASMAAARIDGDLLIDENHATHKAAPEGGPAPARGWIKEMQSRADGSIWGRVEWTEEGRALVAGRAYRGISPVFLHNAKNVVSRILDASLTNIPNLRGMPALNMETPMSFADQVRTALGLAATATEADMLAAMKPATDTALQSSLAEIGVALGVEGGAPQAVLAAARALKAAHAETTGLRERLATVEAAQKRGAAEAWMAGIIAARHNIKEGEREELIALHMEDAARADKIAKLHPTVPGATHTTASPPADADGVIALNAEQLAAAAALGVSAADYLKTLKAEKETR
ncbi:MAG: phage protease [Gemmobacter sp.]